MPEKVKNMQEIRTTYINGHEIPVLISDEKEALLAAKAAGGALIGLWRPGQEMDAISAAKYVVEDLNDVTEEYLERIVRRHLGLPWHICKTERLLIRELFAEDYDEVWENQVGHGFGSVEELEAYTKHQYSFYEFGVWALVEKKTGDLVGVAGLKVPETPESANIEVYELRSEQEKPVESPANCVVQDFDQEALGQDSLELGYHIFPNHRCKGYAREACEAILRYGTEELGVDHFVVHIDKENRISKHLAAELGFTAGK